MEVTRGQVEGAPSMPAGATFTGDVMRHSVLPSKEGMPGMATVIFPPKGRTYWHSHGEGQIIQVSHGSGFVAVRDGDVAFVGPGDVVYAPGGEMHCHGAMEDTVFIQTATSLGQSDWRDEVTDAEYDAIVAKKSQ